MNPNEISWFPMRATYSRELILRDELDRLGIETFLPLKHKRVETATGEEMRKVPAVNNLIFVHSTQERISQLKRSYRSLEPLRYMTRPSENGHENTIIRIPESQMSTFRQVASYNYDEHVVFLENLDFAFKPGPKVRINDGQFQGVEGVLKSMKKHLCVVVPLKGVTAIAITNVPKKHIQKIDDPDVKIKNEE